MSYKVTNRLEIPVRFKGTLFGPRETKILDEKPESDKFIVEKTEKGEERRKMKGGK